jgi:hypothetical protein
VRLGERGHVAAEVREAPRDGDAEAGRRGLEALLEVEQALLERRLRLAQRRPARPDP